MMKSGTLVTINAPPNRFHEQPAGGGADAHVERIEREGIVTDGKHGDQSGEKNIRRRAFFRGRSFGVNGE